MHRGTTLLLAALSWATPVSAQVDDGAARAPVPIELEWDAPPECPPKDEVLASVQAPLGPTSDLHASAVISKESGGYRLELVTEQAGQEGRRSLTAGQCAELGEVTAALLSLALSSAAQEPEPPPRLTPEVPTERRDPVRVWADLGARGSHGTLPRQGVGPLVRIALEWEHARIEWGATGTGAVTLDDVGPGATRYSWAGGVVSACSTWGKAFRYGPCLGVEVGALVGRSQDISDTNQSVQPWVTPTLGFHLGVVRAPWALSLRPLVGVPLVRPRFVVDPVGTVFQPDPVVLGAEAFASFRF